MKQRLFFGFPASLAVLSVAFSVLPLSVEPAIQVPKDRPPAAQAGRGDGGQEIGVLNVRLPVSVLDKEKNRFVTGLTVRNFEVYEDGKKQKIESFESPSQLPLRVGILMDTSNSVKLKLPTEKEAAEDFVATILSKRKKDKILFVTFDSEVQMHVDFTDSEEELIKAIRSVKANGYTRLYDAAYRVVEEKLANPEAVDARRVLVVLSDGEDTGSDRNLKESIEIAQNNDVTIFGISTKNFTGITRGMVTNEDDKLLRHLCDDTGGQLFLPSQKRELFESFTQVSYNLRSEYVLIYNPDNQKKTGKEREIKVKLIGVDGRMHYKPRYKY
ncbi:MAG TPA: VWA domain-containing protein [Blastocatellia bacterium]|nr:VWA domain-containing protein [Blastocatellia bacterium]